MTTKGFYGWHITIALAITETISWGIVYYAFSVFMTPMENDLGWSRAQITGGFSLALLITAGMAFPVGWWIDRHGARLLMTVGSVGATTLIMAWSQVTSLTGFYLIWAGLGICAAAILYEPAFAVISIWFVKQRSTALAVVTFAGGLASTIFLPLSDVLLDAFGWRDAVLGLGILLGVTTIPLHAIVLRRHPHDLGYLPDGAVQLTTDAPQPKRSGVSLSNALHSRFFWLLTLAFSLAYLSAAAIRVHFIPFLVDAGIDASVAAYASGSIGLMQVAGRAIFAPLDHRLSTHVIVSGVFALQAAAMLILIAGASVWMIGLFIIIFGAAYGARTLARPAILAEVFGTSHYGRISSVMVIFLTLAATLAPVGAGWLYDTFGSYEPVLWVVLLLAIGATSVMLVASSTSLRQLTEPAIMPQEAASD